MNVWPIHSGSEERVVMMFETETQNSEPAIAHTVGGRSPFRMTFKPKPLFVVICRGII